MVNITPNDPMYLHPSDHPGMMIVSKIFDGVNFANWKKAVMIGLSAKNKIGFIDGTCVKPENDSPLFSFWQRANDMVTAWILNILSKDISDSVLFANSAKDLWNELEERFGQSNGANLFSVQKELSNLAQRSLDIATYFTKFKKTWDELNNLTSLPLCTCDRATAWAKIEQNQKLIQFLMGLNEDYKIIRGNILMGKLPTVNEAYSILLQEEKQRDINSGVVFNSDSASFNATVNHNVNQFGNKRAPLVCNYCKRPGHIQSKCYKLHGYPIGSDSKRNTSRFQRGKNVAACIHTTGQGNVSISDGDQRGTMMNSLSNFSAEQLNQLMSVISAVQIQSQNKDEGSSSGQLTTTNAINFSGPFHEEASGSW